MVSLRSVTPEEIVRLRAAYEPLFEAAHKKMRYVQSIVDGNYDVFPVHVKGLTEYHPSHPFGRLLKTIDRVAATKPRVHVEPDGNGKQARAIADKTEQQISAWLDAMAATGIMHPWRGLAYFNLLRGKCVGCGPTVSDLFRAAVPASGRRRMTESAFLYTPIDPLEIIHPPTMRRTPPWVMRIGEMEVGQVREAYPFWSDPLMKLGRKEGSYVSLTAFVSPQQIALLADGEPVSNRGPQRNGKTKGEILENPYQRVYYNVLYSGRGYATTAVNASSFGTMSAEARTADDTRAQVVPTTPEERLAVGLLDNNVEDILLQAVVVTAARVYAGRWAKQAFQGGMSRTAFDNALNADVPYFEVKPGQEPVAVLEQPMFPAQVLSDLLGITGSNIELNTLPNIGMGVQVPGITSGYQTRTLQAPVDLQSVALRESIEHIVESVAQDCIFLAKHVMTAEQAAEACRYISREALPDAPMIRVELAPPDEETRARRSSLAEKIRDKLDDDTLRGEFGFENSVEIRRKLALDELLRTPEARAAVIQLGLQRFGLRLQRAQAQALRPPGLSPTGEAATGLTPPVEGVPPTPPGPGSPEEVALRIQQDMAQTVPEPEGMP